MKKIVVIGSSAAGMMAAVGAAKRKSDAEIKVVTSDRVSYRRPAIPALIAGYIKGPEDAEIFTDEVLNRYGIEMIRSARATSIDTKSRSVVIEVGGKEERLPYDSVIIATGGHPVIPGIRGSDKKGVCTFTTFEGAAEIVETARDCESAVIVGAGFIALEIAEALLHKGLDVYFNVRSRILRKLLEPELSEFLTGQFERQGLKMLVGESISEIGGNGRVEYVVHKGKKIATNLVIMGTGVKPNTALAEECGIELGPSGAIKVDNRMESSVADIYAVGDCAESPSLGTDRFVYMPVGSIGACAGSIAGANAAGADEETDGFLRAQGDAILGFQIFSIGHSSTTAKEVGLDVDVFELSAAGSAAADQEQVAFEKGKVVTDSNDRVVGGQLIARKFGSRFACRLYKAVLESVKRKEFLERFGSSSQGTVQTLVQYGP